MCQLCSVVCTVVCSVVCTVVWAVVWAVVCCYAKSYLLPFAVVEIKLKVVSFLMEDCVCVCGGEGSSSCQSY